LVPEGEIDVGVTTKIELTMKEVIFSLDEYEFKKATDGIMTLADFGNIYFQSHEPWKLVKSDREKAGAVVRSCLEIAKALVILMSPVMPTKKLHGSSWA
jgi:methionyl-tRNA synthetase